RPSGAAVLRRLLVASGEQHLGAHACFPRPAAVQPVVRRRGLVLAGFEAILLPLDHAALACAAADERVDRRTRNRRTLQAMLRLSVVPAGLEHLAQQMVGRDGANAPGVARVQYHVVGPQPWKPRAPAHRSLVERGRKAPGRGGRERADITRPRDVVEIACEPAHARDLDKAAEPGKRPVECAGKPRHTALVAGERGAAPLIAAIEEPDAGKA